MVLAWVGAQVKQRRVPNSLVSPKRLPGHSDPRFRLGTGFQDWLQVCDDMARSESCRAGQWGMLGCSEER